MADLPSRIVNSAAAIGADRRPCLQRARRSDIMAIVFKNAPDPLPPMPTRHRRPRFTPRALPAALLALAGAVSIGAPLQAAEPALRPWPAGQATPPLQLVGLDGQDWDLARLRGKVVVVNFWASWCEPCVHELPVLGALAGQPGFDGRVAVVGVNYKESLDAIERFTAAHPIPYPVVRDKTGDMFKRWTAGVMPTTILVDRQGRARWRTAGEIGPGDTRLKSAIAALLAQ
jgi:thiol-disulfide isomerase/thioredoxin